MRYSTEHKQETHRRIVEEAARQFRERGLDAVSVADVMAAAGLTHGGFYAHFASKEELIAEALRSVKGAAAGRLRPPEGDPAEADAPAPQAVAAMVRRYLSLDHRERPGSGCVVAALGTEAPRHSPAARQELAERARGLAQAFLPYLQERSGQPAQEQAIGVAATLVGGLILARLEAEPAAAERVLSACRRFVLDALNVDDGRADA
jgi:TetR/AcrR family transcriptional regulator, transcriptional repressor for nem operon